LKEVTVNIGGADVPRLILGNLPFLGESYQGPEKNRLYAERFSNVENTAKILRCAISEHGLTAVGAMPSANGRLARLFFEALERASSESGIDVGLVACFRIPMTIGGKPVDDYRRWVTYYAIEAGKDAEAEERYLRDPILLCREGWETRFPQALVNLEPYSPEDFSKIAIDKSTLEKTFNLLEGLNIILVEPGSETDFLALTGRLDVLEELVAYSKDRLRCPVVLGTHHAGSTIPILEGARLDIAGYVTPVNPIGALMLPTQKRALKAIFGSFRPIIAIKPLAGGRVSPSEAFNYVFNEVGAACCMFGAASEEELQVDVEAAKSVLGSGRTTSVPQRNR
jgi:hypothetical protein